MRSETAFHVHPPGSMITERSKNGDCADGSEKGYTVWVSFRWLDHHDHVDRVIQFYRERLAGLGWSDFAEYTSFARADDRRYPSMSAGKTRALKQFGVVVDAAVGKPGRFVVSLGTSWKDTPR